MLSGLFTKNETLPINWKKLTDVSQLSEIDRLSMDHPVAIFKHSTRCSISAMVLNRFERSYQPDAHFTLFFLDLISFRDISNEIARRYHVIHESPQLILLYRGDVIYHASHNGIDFDEVNESSQKLK